MKRCPECNSFFPDTEQFCELDGTLLVAAPNPSPVDRTGAAPQSKSSGTLLPMAVLVGILLGVLLSLIYFAMSRQTTPENSNTTSSSSSARQQEVVRPLQAAPPATASPSVEPSVEPSPSPGSASSPQSSPAQTALSSSDPISTAPGGKGGPVVIKLDSGATIEADEAWQTGEGIWYRKHGIVTLLDPRTVKAVEKVAPQPAASTSPSP